MRRGILANIKQGVIIIQIKDTPLLLDGFGISTESGFQ